MKLSRWCEGDLGQKGEDGGLGSCLLSTALPRSGGLSPEEGLDAYPGGVSKL